MGYYFIAIGGSGAKVMESLTHFAAAGLLPNRDQQEKLYIMSVDPDVGNGNLARSSAALNNLVQFQELATGLGTPLLKTKVKVAQTFPWSPTEHNRRLDDILMYQTNRGTPVGDLYETLYTQAEREMLLNEGFRGRPSIGAAVLARRASLFSEDGWENHADAPWDEFARLVKQDAKNGSIAKIFLAGSVFGGTGAAGMPTVARLLQHEFRSFCEKGTVMIGGALILPYFSFTPETDEEIFASSENFLTNTKAALKYYAQKAEADGANIFDAMYLIGDSDIEEVKTFSIGAATQKNDAHMVDFYGAMAALDFYASKPEDVKPCSYIAHSEEKAFVWSDFPDIAGEDGPIPVKKTFAQFVRFIFSYVHLIEPVLHGLASGEEKLYKYPWYVDFLQDVNIDAPEVKNFGEYAESFARWLQQVEQSAGGQGRTVQLVKAGAFGADPASVEEPEFQTCIYDENSDVTMHEIFTRLAEKNGKGPEHTEGFGRFLRALYDSCETSEKH